MTSTSHRGRAVDGSGPMPGIDHIVNLHDVEELALRQVDPAVAAYYLGGADDEHTLRDNRAAFDRYRLLPRIGDGGLVSTGTTLLGTEVSMPVGISPTAAHGLVCGAGELATAGAARSAHAMFCASSASSQSVEQIARSAGEAWWYQCYPGTGVGLGRAAELHYKAIVLTVDVPVSGHRDQEFQSQRQHPDHPMYDARWAYARPGADLSAGMSRTRLTWPEIRDVIATSDVPVVLKGILTASDARKAAGAGAAAVWVSNHGARQLDRVPATIDVLTDIVSAVGGNVEVYVDGGFRRGVEVAIALALGARAVFLGRPVVMGLAAGGEHGAEVVLEQMRKELVNAMYLLGVDSLDDLDRSVVMRVDR